MKLIIAGSRTFWHEKFYGIIDAMITLQIGRPSHVVCGLAKGIDATGKFWAEYNKIPVLEFAADWDTHGKAAGHIRNTEMASVGDALLLIWDGKSRGSANMLKQATERGLIVYQVIVPS